MTEICNGFSSLTLICIGTCALFVSACSKDEPKPAAEKAPPAPANECVGKKAMGCLHRALKLQKGDGVKRNPGVALELFEKVCSGGDAKGCTMAARVHAAGAKGVPKNGAKALELYALACNTGEPNACNSAGNAYGIGQLGAAVDSKRAADLLQRGCDGGVLEACGLAPIMRGTSSADPAVLEPKCDAGDANACARLGLVREHGASPDGPKACAAFEKACEGGNALSCRVVGRHYFDGRVCPRNLAKSAALYETGCEKGSMNACFLLAVLLKKGFGVTADPKRSQELVKKACDGGLKSACQHVGK